MLESAGGLLGSFAGGTVGAKAAFSAMRGWKPTNSLGVIFKQGWGGGPPKVIADKHLITRLSQNGQISEARNVLKPMVNNGDVDGMVARLDVTSPTDRAAFWSGEAAKNEAAKEFMTLEQTAGGKVIDGWSYPKETLPKEEFYSLWTKASESYASQASGKVTVFQTPEKAAIGGGDTYRNFELPKILEGLTEGRITGVEMRTVP